MVDAAEPPEGIALLEGLDVGESNEEALRFVFAEKIPLQSLPPGYLVEHEVEGVDMDINMTAGLEVPIVRKVRNRIFGCVGFALVKEVNVDHDGRFGIHSLVQDIVTVCWPVDLRGPQERGRAEPDNIGPAVVLENPPADRLGHVGEYAPGPHGQWLRDIPCAFPCLVIHKGS